MTAGQQYETMTRTYPATNSGQFDRDARQLAAQGWVVARITQRQQNRGCARWLTWGTIFIQPPLELQVTYRRRHR